MPFGFNPVIAATAAIKTAIVSQVSHVIDLMVTALVVRGAAFRRTILEFENRVYRNMFLTTNQTFAGRSASRRMYQGNQYSP